MNMNIASSFKEEEEEEMPTSKDPEKCLVFC